MHLRVGVFMCACVFVRMFVQVGILGVLIYNNTSKGIIIHDKARILSTLLSLFKYFSSSSLIV